MRATSIQVEKYLCIKNECRVLLS